ncbi:Uncharacterised protein [Pseudomonas aeruginosa]|nr:Uncharacterised protein [Pseudomonas aeruginosa]
MKRSQQALPGFGQGRQARTDDLLRADPGEFLDGAVPHQHFLVLGQGADAHRQVLQGLPVVAAQGVEFGSQASQPGVIVLQAALDEVDVLGDVAFFAGLVGKEGLHDVLGDTGSHQPGKVRLDAVAQATQGIGATFVEGQVEIAQGLLDLLLRGLGAQRLGQLAGELLRRTGEQFAALRTAYVVHRAGLGGAFFLVAGLGEQRHQGEYQHVGRQRGQRRQVPVRIVQHVDHVEQRQVQALYVPHQGQQHGDRPDQHAGDQPGDEATAVGGRPVQHREGAGKELQGGDEGHYAQVGEVLFGAQQQVEGVAGHDDGDDQQAPGPFQPAVDVALRRRLVERQHQVVEDHSRERQGHHDSQPAGGGDAADEGGQGQGRAVHRQAEADGVVLRCGRGAEAQPGPEDRRYRQAHQQQEQRQAPTGGNQRARVEVLGEDHVEHVRHHDGRGEEHQQQRSPWTFGQRRVQGGQRGLVLQQPDFQAFRPAEDAVQGVEADTAEHHQLDQRLEGDGEHQSLVAFAGGDVASAEEDREQGDQGAEDERDPLLGRVAGENADRIGDRLDLQGQHRQHADQHEQRGQGAGPGTAETEGEEVGQRGQLVGACHPEDRIEQHRGEQEGPGNPQVDGEEPVAVLVGQAYRAVERPGTGVDAQRQGVDQRVAYQPARHVAALGDPGDAEEGGEVGDADQDQLGQAKARQHRAGSAG